MSISGSILGNNALAARLDEIIGGGRFFHACILSGAYGTGKKMLARLLAMAAVCTGEGKPCGVCSGCKKAESGVHPDIITVSPDGAFIKIEQIRALRQELFLRPNEAPRRAVTILEAERMNAAAQNTLLNILEEPPSDVLFVLVCENEAALLETVRSRCVSLRLSPLDTDTIYDELHRRLPDFGETALKSVARDCGGSLGRALELAAGEAETDISALTAAFSARDRAETLRFAFSLERMKAPQLAAFFAAFRSELRDALAKSPSAVALTAAFSPKTLMSAVSICEKLASYTEANVSAGHISGVFAVELLALM